MWKGNVYIKSIDEFCESFVNEAYESYDGFPNPKHEYDIDIMEEEIDIQCTDEVINNIIGKLLEKPDIKEAYRLENKLIIVLDEEHIKENNPELFEDDEF